METRAHHVLIGLFTLIVALLVVLFALWAAKFSANKGFNEYNVVFNEAVTGLSNGSIVLYNGINVGSVRQLSLDKNDPNKVIVRIRVGDQTPVKVDTEAKLAIVGLTGVTQIQLSGGSVGSPRLQPKAGENIAVIIAKESALTKLLSSTEDIATTTADVLFRLNRMLNDDNLRHIAQTLDNLDAITSSVSGERQSIASLIGNLHDSSKQLQRTLHTTDRAMSGIDQELVSKLPGLVDKLDRTLAQLDSFSRNANGVLADNKDALDALGNQGLSQIGPTLSELRSLLRDLDRLSNRIGNNPAGFMLGRDQPKEFKP